jgi:hypothetical protein
MKVKVVASLNITFGNPPSESIFPFLSSSGVENYFEGMDTLVLQVINMNKSLNDSIYVSPLSMDRDGEDGLMEDEVTTSYFSSKLVTMPLEASRKSFKEVSLSGSREEKSSMESLKSVS